jgi:L-ribulose-5-phosphate 3-epimerase
MATPELSVVEALDLASELGLDGIDLVCQGKYRCGIATDAAIKDAHGLKRAAADRGLIIGALTPYEKGFNRGDREERALAVANLAHAVRLAEALGAGSVRVLAGDEVEGHDRLPRFELLVATLREAACEAEGRGIALNIENHDGTMADSAERTREIWQAINHSGVGIIYDPANLIRDSKEPFPENFEIQKEAIKLVHVKDYIFAEGVKLEAANGASRACAPVGDGVVPWTTILAALKAGGYAGDLSLEYEMRWWPEQLPATRIGVGRSKDYLRAILRNLNR